MNAKGRQFQAYLALPQVKAFLDTIAWAEGGRSYTTLYGGGNFSGFATHPNRLITAGGYSSTAAGRYQILKRTFDSHSAALGTSDFSPATQDLMALREIEVKGGLPTLLNGDFLGTLKALGAGGRCAWAALPFAGCNQRMRDYDATLRYYNGALAVYGGNNPAPLGALPPSSGGQQTAAISTGTILIGGLILLLILDR